MSEYMVEFDKEHMFIKFPSKNYSLNVIGENDRFSIFLKVVRYDQNRIRLKEQMDREFRKADDDIKRAKENKYFSW